MAKPTASDNPARPQQTNARQSGESAGNSSEKGEQSGEQTDAISLLKADHQEVLSLFEKYKELSSEAEKSATAMKICKELNLHTQLEEEIFYPACREKNIESHLLDEAQVEHDGAKLMIMELLNNHVGSDFYDAKVAVLGEYIKHHVGEEEKPSDGIFAKAQEAGLDMKALGQRIQARKHQLMLKTEAMGIRSPSPRSLSLSSQLTNPFEDQAMASENYRRRDEEGRFASDDRDYGRQSDRGYSRSSRSNERERDEYGRFTSEDDERGGRGYRSGGQERDEYGRFTSGEDERGGRGYRSSGRERDEYGRFMSDDDERGYGGRGGGYRSSGRDEYYEDQRRGRSGWYGDPEAHSEASQRGWESRYRDEDEEYGERSSRGRHGGWFGDPEGHSQAASRRWEGSTGRSSRGRDEDEGERSSRGRHGGWFGDPEGHSQAASRRWEGDRGRSSRSSRDEDDDRRGTGGWFGDSRGHSEAARRGWQNR